MVSGSGRLALIESLVFDGDFIASMPFYGNGFMIHSRVCKTWYKFKARRKYPVFTANATQQVLLPLMIFFRIHW